jgi:hypothetical protein
MRNVGVAVMDVLLISKHAGNENIFTGVQCEMTPYVENARGQTCLERSLSMPLSHTLSLRIMELDEDTKVLGTPEEIHGRLQKDPMVDPLDDDLSDADLRAQVQ